MRQLIEPKILYFGTPVVLISTMNEDNTPNLAPISSAWALGWNIALGLSGIGKTFENIERTGECVLNFPSSDLWQNIEMLAPFTGKKPVPMEKSGYSKFEKNKFGKACLTPINSENVDPPAVEECPLQMETKVMAIHDLGNQKDNLKVVIVKVLKVYANPMIISDKNHINPKVWSPLIYNFRHYFGLGTELGKTFRSET